MKKTFDSPVKQSTIDLTKYHDMIADIRDSIESYPLDMDKLRKVLYEINSPDFKYPEFKEKCCKTCTAFMENDRLRKALNIIKTITIDDPREDILEKIDRMGLVYSIDDWSLRGKRFKKVKA